MSPEARLSLTCCHVRIPATKTSSFILALGSPAAPEKDGVLPIQPPSTGPHAGRDLGTSTLRSWSHGCPKPCPKLLGSPQLQEGLFHSTSLALAPCTASSCRGQVPGNIRVAFIHSLSQGKAYARRR